MFKIITALIFIFAPLLTSAAELKYFEFAPDTANTININSNGAYQPFYPQNDFISGLDVWIINPGAAGTASFGLRDGSDNLLTSKTISVPSVASTWSGYLLHINFPESIQVESSALYKIRMISSLPDLKFFYGNKTQLLLHNAYPAPEKLLLPAKINDLDQNFFFKIALYEDGDTLSPVISNANLISINNTSARLEFNANEPLDYKITFTSQINGSSQIKDFGNAYEFCNVEIINCGSTFNVEPGAGYNYQIIGRDANANETIITGAVNAAVNPSNNNPPPNNSGISPILSNVRISYLSPHSITINWQTDKAANSNLAISLDSAGNRIVASAIDPTYELIHNLSSGNVLLPETQYFGALSSADPQGNAATQILSFTTQAQAPASTSTPPSETPTIPPTEQSNPPVNQNPLPMSSSTINLPPASQNNGSSNLPEAIITISPQGNTIIIEWLAPLNGEPKDGYQIDIFRASDYTLERRIKVPAGTHRAEIEGLLPGNYYTMVYGNNSGILEKIAKATLIQIATGQVTFYKKPIFYVIIIVIAIIAALLAFYFVRLKGI